MDPTADLLLPQPRQQEPRQYQRGGLQQVLQEQNDFQLAKDLQLNPAEDTRYHQQDLQSANLLSDQGAQVCHHEENILDQANANFHQEQRLQHNQNPLPVLHDHELHAQQAEALQDPASNHCKPECLLDVSAQLPRDQQPLPSLHPPPQVQEVSQKPWTVLEIDKFVHLFRNFMCVKQSD